MSTAERSGVRVADATEKWIERLTAEHVAALVAIRAEIAALAARVEAIEKKDKKP